MPYTLTVAQTTTQASFAFSYSNNLTCTLSGAIEQHGQIFEMPNATYSCTGTSPFTTTAAMSEIKSTAQGIEGRWTAALGGTCREDARFSAAF